MDKGIGFNRIIYLPWLEATAALCAETEDPAEIRRRLDPVVGQQIASSVNRRKAIDILINLWVKSREAAPDLRAEAVGRFRSALAAERIWLHYGLCLLRYPFFRQTAAALGQASRLQEAITPAMVKQRLVAERGELGSLDKAVERVLLSLSSWGVLARGRRGSAYQARRQVFSAGDVDLEAWLLACALRAHPSEEIPFEDLLRLPELFPFRFALALDDLRARPLFTVHRQGGGLDMVRVAAFDRSGANQAEESFC